ncbi:hypothetical protein [Clostridium sp.]|uniref:DUF2357 domain-containing protein n=1 Tax=Clostridium sp. TaxID=1506 RepID=UPI002FCB0DC5
MECRLILQTKFAGDLSILLTETTEKNLLLNSSIGGVVYSDMEYDATIIFSEEIEDIKIYINDTLRECFYNNGKIFFQAPEYLDKRIFLNYFGYVSFTINIKTATTSYEFYSKYLDVAIRDNISSELIRKMVSYISNNSQKYLFNEDSNVKDFADVKKSENKNTDTEISILESILFEYESNFKYFKSNTKYRIEDDFVVDDFEKVKEVNKQTIQHILSNPQNLVPVNYNTGIVYNKLNLQPKKTLVNKNKISYNIYENKIILGFLKSIYNSLSNKINDIESNIYRQQGYSIRTEYSSSSNEIYKEINKVLEKYKDKLESTRVKIQQLYFMYRQILKCDEVSLNYIPKPSDIFMRVQHYRKIYKVIRDWYEGGNYDLRNEKMILTFSEASEIYEYYTLLRINNYIAKNQYSLKESVKFNYKFRKSTKYINTKHENTFTFEKGQTSLKVYYQPVIYNEHVHYDNNIGLFRNNDISFDGERGQYYTPDYVIKISENGFSNFLILDAKWSSVNSVFDHSIKRIAYNYALSISTINPNDVINKIWIINGKETQNQQKYLFNFYNSRFEERNNQLTPSIKVFTLNPNIDECIQNEVLKELFYLI